MQFIERDQPTTGDPKLRTRREEIVPVFEAGVNKEVRLGADGSESTGWASDATYAVWPIQTDMIVSLVEAIEFVDSKMEEEQAAHAGTGPDDSADADEGGVMSAFFNDTYVPVGDLNKENVRRKIAALKDPRDHKPLPHGGTKIGGAVQYLDGRYLKEFAKDPKTGLWVPVDQRPTIATVVSTDGAMADAQAFVYRLEMDRKRCAYLAELEDLWHGLWPAEEWFVAALGEGDDHNAMVKLYKEIAQTYTNVHVMDFAGVRNGLEAAEDVAHAMLNTK